VERSLEEAKETLGNLDNRTLDERAKNLVELGITTLSAIDRELSERMHDFVREAATTYINECYRSCIFCCAAAVEQAFKHEMILAKNPKERGHVQEILDKKTFGRIISEAEDVNSLAPFIEDARWLKNRRNKIAIHPVYFTRGSLVHGKEVPEINEWRKETIKRDINAFLQFLEKEEGESLREALSNPITLKDILEWGFSPPLVDPLHALALRAHKKMKVILEGLYPEKVIKRKHD
jgi:hypothetical protein